METHGFSKVLENSQHIFLWRNKKKKQYFSVEKKKKARSQENAIYLAIVKKSLHIVF